MRCPFRAMRRTLHFWNHIIANNNAHSFACVLLFPKSTKYLLGSPDLRYRNITTRRTAHIAALAHIAFADRQKHRTIAFTMCPFREIATALQATSRNDIKCFARSGISDVAYSTLSVIEQSNAATNPYFATFCPIFFLFRENCIKKCLSFPLHL